MRLRRTSAWGFPFTVDPGTVRTTDFMPVPAAGTAIYSRVRDAGTITAVGARIGTQGGTMSVGVYRNTGTGRGSAPGARLAATAAFTTPTPGYYEFGLGQAVSVQVGDWLALSADGTVATFQSLLVAGGDSDLGKGRQYRQPGAHPLPAAPAGLVATVGYTFVLVGIP